jgi:hypothetical protein
MISAEKLPRKDVGGVVDDDGSGWYDHDPRTSNPIDDLFNKMNVLSSLDTPGETMSQVTTVMLEQEEALSTSVACSTPYSADFIHNSHVFSLDCSTPSPL